MRFYTFTAAVSLSIFIAVVTRSGLAAVWPLLILAVIEITFSFDNAVVNSQVLTKMSRFWRLMFLTVGIIIAVFGVRLILPLILVSSTTGESLGGVLNLALNNPEDYETQLLKAYPVIAAFGGVFLLMVGLRFLAEDHAIKWLRWVEAPIASLKKPWLIPILGAVIAAAFIGLVLKPGDSKVLIAAIAGAVIFLIIKSLSVLVETRYAGSKHSGWINFLYLEVLDASFSFDSVVAAFAISKDIVIIAAGLGIGAFFVRSITIHLLEHNTIASYRYLVHGAHYAITMLAVVLLLSVTIHIPEAVTGILSVTVIGLAIYTSRVAAKKDKSLPN